MEAGRSGSIPAHQLFGSIMQLFLVGSACTLFVTRAFNLWQGPPPASKEKKTAEEGQKGRM